MRKLKPWQTFEQTRHEERARNMALQFQKATAVAEDLQRRLTPPTATAVAVDDPTVFNMEEYRQLVAELEVDDTAIRNYEFRQFLAAEGIQVYDYAKVATFMDAKTKEEAQTHRIEKLTWKWKPLNEKYPDVPKSPGASGSNSFVDFAAAQMGRSFFAVRSLQVGDLEWTAVKPSRAYSRAIPHAVLLTVKKIRDRFKEAVHFYATDYEVQHPDPFLMVTGEGLDYYVIERWDEPTFRS